MTLTDNTRTDADEYMRNRIEELIIDGQILTADDDVLLECARRYVASEHNRRNRQLARNVEAFQKTKVEERAKLMTRISSITTALANHVSPGLAPKLLASTFAVGGVDVSWADATVEQHEQRALWLEAHAAGTLETATIHRQAIVEILAAKRDTLEGVIDALIAC